MKHPRDHHVVLCCTSLSAWPCTCMPNLSCLWALETWGLDLCASQSCQPGRVLTAFGSELFQVTKSSCKNDTIFCSIGRTTESRTENSINGMKKTCFVLQPSLQNVPIGSSGGFTSRKKQPGTFPAVVGLPEVPGKWTCLNGEVSHYLSEQFLVCGNLKKGDPMGEYTGNPYKTLTHQPWC